MLHLSSRHLRVLNQPAAAGPFVARVTSNTELPEVVRASEALLLPAVDGSTVLPRGFKGYLLRAEPPSDFATPPNCFVLPPSLEYLADGDVIRVSSKGNALAVLYRKASTSNSLLTTERCNHFCLMCSQPPKEVDDSYIVDELLAAIPLFDPGTREIGLTGGEPTLLGERLIELLRCFRNYLPNTAIHVLSNGRRFIDMEYVEKIASLRCRDLMFGIPLYADVADIHDYVVQSQGAFDETIRGILNLKRAGVQVELRFVMHRDTYGRLPQFADFVTRNLRFVDHVALMGLEPIGFAKANAKTLWIDPVEYQAELQHAVYTLAAARLRTSVYNHQLCVTAQDLWPYAQRSISDWKNEYLPQCDGCMVKHKCGGFFSSARSMHSSHIKPVVVPKAS